MSLRARFDDLLRSGLEPGDVDAGTLRRVRTINLCAVLVIAVGVPFVFQYYALGVPLMSAAVALAIVGGVVVMVYLRRTREVDRAGTLATCVLMMLVVLSNSVSGGFYDPNFGWLYVVPVVAGLVVGARMMRLFTGLVVVATVVYFALAESGMNVPDLIPPDEHARQSLANRVTAIVTIGLLIQAFLWERDRSERRLVEARERIEEQTANVRTMLRNIRQGICSILPGRVLHADHSTHLATMLGTDRIAGRSLDELLLDDAGLAPDARSAMEATIDACLGSESLTFDLNEHLLPRELTRTTAHGEQILELDWAPWLDASGKVERLMLTLRDVTAYRDLEARAQLERDELTIVGELLHCPVDDYRTYMSSMRGGLERTAGRLDDAPALMRTLHTMKGEARTVGWLAIADAAHQAEDACTAEVDVAPALARLDDVIRRYVDVWTVVLGRESARETSPGTATVALDELLARPLASLRDAADRQRKTLPHLTVEASVTVSSRFARPLRQALSHLLTNALDHGIEADTVREAAGKSVPGTIRVHAKTDADEVVLVVADDGAGVRLDALPEEGLEGLFASGVSTAARTTSTSGRGVGLDAARQLVQQHGGSLEAAFTGAAQDGHRPIAFELRLPARHFG